MRRSLRVVLPIEEEGFPRILLNKLLTTLAHQPAADRDVEVRVILTLHHKVCRLRHRLSRRGGTCGDSSLLPLSFALSSENRHPWRLDLDRTDREQTKDLIAHLFRILDLTHSLLSALAGLHRRDLRLHRINLLLQEIGLRTGRLRLKSIHLRRLVILGQGGRI